MIQNLGSFDKYVYDGKVFPAFEGAMGHKGHGQLDITAVIEFISRYHFFGDRTLVRGISKTPWYSKSTLEGGVSFQELPPHGKKILSIDQASDRFYELLYEEVETYIEGKNSIGILLSGGMDSRIVAGIVREIQKVNPAIRVTALTWGIPDSRDVIYARKISNQFNWEWKYFELTAECLFDAIEETATVGAEFSPIHLHAMHKVRDLKDIDIILGGSYGDSVGRAEFSGKHVLKVPEINKYVFNWFGLIKSSAYRKFASGIGYDVQVYRDRFPRNEEYQYREVERQCHYMRRMLNPCMGVINQKIPVKQIFTNEKVFGFMWSLDPSLRDDRIYNALLKKIDPTLSEIPWARTGRKYLSEQGQSVDEGLKLNNKYGIWVRNDLRADIEEAISSDEIRSLGIFNIKSIKSLHKASINYFSNPRASKLDEVLIWIASLKKVVSKYNIEPEDFKTSIEDDFRSRSVGLEGYLYSKIFEKRN